MTAARTTDRRVTVLLPVPSHTVPPVTARIQRRAILVYGVVWLLGALPACWAPARH